MTSKSDLNQSTKQILDWEEELNLLETKPYKAGKKPAKEKITANDMEVIETTMKNSSPEKKEKMERSSDPLMKDAREKLNYYLKKIPTYSSLDSQAKLLQLEMNNYKRNNEIEKYDACVVILKTIQEKTSEIKNVFIPSQGEKLRIKNQENYEKIKSSPLIKDLIQKEKEIKANLTKNSTNKIVDKLTQIRKMMKITESNDEIIDFDEYDFETNTKIYDDYEEILTNISDITGYLVDELKEMPISSIKASIAENIDNTELNNDLKAIRAQIQDEKDKIGGVLTLTNIVNKLYDIKGSEKDEAKVKEILASTHIGMVKSFAYNACSKSGKLDQMQYSDCVSAGLLALTGAINGWIEMQKVFPTSLSFKGWARIAVQNAIKREILLFQSGGRLSGSSMADIMSKENKKLSTFLEYHPQYKEFDREIVLDIVLGLETEEINKNSKKKKKVLSTRDTKAIVSQSDIVNSGEDADEGNDIWSTVTKDTVTDMTEAKSEYTELINSISELLKNMNKYDRRLFMMYYGFEKNPEKSNVDGKTVTNNYKQTEMAQELYNMYLANGITPAKAANGTFSQPAISYRINKIGEDIANTLKERPELKKGFEFLMTYWLQNSDMLETMSNNREELGMKLERDMLRDHYSDDEDTLNIQLSDGKKLKDAFDISKSNPLDSDDIFSIFN